MAKSLGFYEFIEQHGQPRGDRNDVDYYRAIYAEFADRSLVYENTVPRNWNGQSPLRTEHRRWLERAGTAGDYTWAFHGSTSTFILMFTDPNTAFAFRMRCSHATIYRPRVTTLFVATG